MQNMDIPEKELSKPGFILHFKQRIKSSVSGKDTNFEMRKALWRAGWEIYKDHPLTGCGFRCVDLLHNQYPDPTGYVKKLRGCTTTFFSLLWTLVFLVWQHGSEPGSILLDYYINKLLV